MVAGPPEAGRLPGVGGADVQVLGRLFSYLLLLETLPDTGQMAGFLESVFVDLPGVSAGKVVLGTDVSLPAVEGEGETTQVVVPVETGSGLYGGFLLELADPQAFEPYRPFLVNLASSVAVLTENRVRRAELETALEAVRESERVRDVAESIARVGSWRFDFATQRATWSPEMYRLFAVPEDYDGGLPTLLETRIHPDDRAAVQKATAQVMSTGEGASVEYRVVWPDGTEHVIHGEGVVERDADGHPVAVSGYYQDVTDQRRAEAEISGLNAELEARVASRTARLETVNKELETFAYSVSHDLRAPLRAIDGFSQMVVEDAGGRLAEDDLDHLQRVRNAAQRMAAMIDNLLALSRASRTELSRERVDVGAVALSVFEDLRMEQPERQVSFSVAPDLCVDADATLVRVIVANLLGNAWKFTSKRESAHIEVGVTGVAGERAFFVRDDGIGFDMERAEHLFGAFQRMHEADKFAGDGIGLATVQRLVSMHGGRVWAESRAAEGATFYFTLSEQSAAP
jgi:signal transduction histidine kinase